MMPPFVHSSQSGGPFEVHRFAGPFGGHPFFGGLVALFVLGVLVVLAVAAVSVLIRGTRFAVRPSLAGHPHAAPAAPPAPRGSDDALRILNERLARGEIDADDYTTRRDLLTK